MRIAKGAISWIILSFFSGCLFFLLFLIFNSSEINALFLTMSSFFFLLLILFIIFFRDPEREIGKGIVAPADGKIREISRINDADVGDCLIISTFMNIYNVHVNRAPIDGVVKKITYLHGSHLPAFKKESERNERLIILIDTKIGSVKLVQIAGTLARRIERYINVGDKLNKGDRIGIIKLGSRVDLYVPYDRIKELKVRVGESVKAGVSCIAEIND